MPILVYTENESPRLDYILDFILCENLGLEYFITMDLEYFTTSSDFKINYSKKEISDPVFRIIPHGLLHDHFLSEPVLPKMIEGIPYIFETGNSFDLFSACFFLISRMEEYTMKEVDEYGRFPHKLSLAYQHHFLNLPVVDIWIEEFKKQLQACYPDLQVKNRTFRFQPTYDIDIAYSYKGKSPGKTFGGYLKSIGRLDFYSIGQRTRVLNNREKDPYDAYDYLNQIHDHYHLEPLYFFLLSRGGKLDKNLPPNSEEMKQLIKGHGSRYMVGIHPSYRSNDNEQELESEIGILKELSEMEIRKSRQHYIRFLLPHTYRKLVDHGITDDYSMGYGSINGFRAGTSRSFYWFDLEKNKKTSLRVHPFCFMECNSRFEQGFNTEETIRELKNYIDLLKKYKGIFCPIWHNFSLGTDPGWRGWRSVFEYMMHQCDENPQR